MPSRRPRSQILHHSPARRALVSLVAAVLVLGVLPGLPVSATGPIQVAAREVSVALERQRVVELPIEASHVALHWRGQHDAALTVAFSAEGVAFGAPSAVEHDEVGEQRGNGETYGAVIHAAGARFVRVTSDRPIARLTVLALDSTGSGGSPVGFGGATVAAAVSQPSVITRAAWGADESLRFWTDGTQKWIPAFYPVQKLIVHHTAGKNADPDPAATIRSIYYYHAITQGWGDIGYNFLVDESGQIYEGRYSRPYAAGESPTGEDATGNGVTAAHVLGYNSGTVGIALLGTLTNVDTTAKARDVVERMLAWKAERHAIDPLGSSLYTNPVNGTQRTFANIAGHRDLAATECPGGAFYSTLPALRQAVAARIAGSGGTLLTITTTSLPAGTVDQDYGQTVEATGGTMPYTWSIAVGTLPPGLTLNALTGIISGRPTTASTYSFTAAVTDSSTLVQTVSKALSIVVNSTAPLTITTTILPDGKRNRLYSASVAATGGTTPYTWSIAQGTTLPPGLTLDPLAGTISGKPTKPGNYSFTISVSDRSTLAQTASKALSIKISK